MGLSFQHFTVRGFTSKFVLGMLNLHRTTISCCALALLAFFLLYANAGQVKTHFNWIDIASEAGVAAFAGMWLWLVLSSRPAGRVTLWLSLGLSGIMLAAWVDCLDEFFAVGKNQLWNHLLEGGLSLAGLASLTLGLFYWRGEQFLLNAHLQKRERLFRNHRPFDQVTQLADADYLRSQLKQCQHAATPAILVMLDINQFHLINRQFGQAEGDRVLHAVSHLLLLNLRNQDLLCRYAGDRFAILLPNLSTLQAQNTCQQLCQALSQLHHHAQQGVIRLTARYAVCPVQGDAQNLLQQLCRQLEHSAGATPIADLIRAH